MTRFPNFRGAGRLARYASTILTVSLLVTLKVETPCSPDSPVVQPGLGATSSHELHEVRLRQP